MNRSFKMFLSLVSLLMFGGVVMPVAANAQLKPCLTTVPAPPYKIFVDGMRKCTSTGDTENIQDLKKRIGVAVSNNLAEIKIQLLETKLKQQKSLPDIQVIPCDDVRFPSSTAAFSDAELRTLAESRVLLEIWGDVLSAEKGTAYLGYALAPAFKVQLPSVYSIRQNIAPSSTSGEELFKENKELKAYAQMVVGIQFYRNDDFDVAIGYLCGGALKLERALAERPQLTSADERLFKLEQQKLISGVRALATDAIHQAGQRPESSISAVSGGSASCPVKEN
jgi:hypothetical protein